MPVNNGVEFKGNWLRATRLWKREILGGLEGKKKLYSDFLERPMILACLRISSEPEFERHVKTDKNNEWCLKDECEFLAREDERRLENCMLQVSLVTKSNYLPYVAHMMPIKGDLMYWSRMAAVGNLKFKKVEDGGANVTKGFVMLLG